MGQESTKRESGSARRRGHQEESRAEALLESYKELYDTCVKRSGYDPEVGDALHRLYEQGRDLHGKGFNVPYKQAVEWQKATEAFLKKHLPGELRMFQTIGDEKRTSDGENSRPGRKTPTHHGSIRVPPELTLREHRVPFVRSSSEVPACQGTKDDSP